MTPMKLPRCIGMCSAWHKVVPRVSNNAVEQSRRSLMFVEKLARTSASPISSTIDDSALPITSTVIGSLVLAGENAGENEVKVESTLTPFSPHFLYWRSWQRQPQIEVRVDGGGGAGRDQSRGSHRLAGRGTFNAVAGTQPLA